MTSIAANDLIVMATSLEASVPQWDGKTPTTGIMLRWFLKPLLGLPDLGFDIRRSSPLEGGQWLLFPAFFVERATGKTQWMYGDVLLLSCTAGLRFATVPGSNDLFAVSVSPGEGSVGFGFAKTCVQAVIVAGPGDNDLTLEFATALVDGELVMASESINLQGSNNPQIVIPRPFIGFSVRGQGSIMAIAVVFADEPSTWPRIAHRCLPVFDAGYPCAHSVGGSEADEARSRLPPSVAAEWPSRFAAPFAGLLPVLRRLALGSATQAIPKDADYPEASISGDERALLDIYSLDPHGARILGLAYDDAVPLDGKTYCYRVTGRWRGPPVLAEGVDLNPKALYDDYRVVVSSQDGNGGRGIVIAFPVAVEQLSLSVAVPDGGCSIETVDSDGVPTWRQFDAGPAIVDAPNVVRVFLAWSNTREDLLLTRLQWISVAERSGLVAIVASPRAAPAGPASAKALALENESPTAPSSAALDWTVAHTDGLLPEGACVCYQIGRRQLNADPMSPPPTVPAASDADLLYDRAPIYLATSASPTGPAGPVPRHIDRNRGAGLGAGWWGWWLRGVDLFGRVSSPSPWALAAIVDRRRPLPPLMVAAEWVQRDLPAGSVAATGRSAMARRWLGSSNAAAGLLACWVCGPEQLIGADDVDGFQLLVRTPVRPPGSPPDARLAYGPWPTPAAGFGPQQVVIRATVDALPRGASTDTLNVQITGIAPMPDTADLARPTESRLRCRTTLDLDGASGLFAGGSLDLQGHLLPIVGNGDGPDLDIVVSLPAGTPLPLAGSATLRLPPERTLVEIAVPASTAMPAGGLVARSGVLLVQMQAGEQRLAVLARDGTRFLCLGSAIGVSLGGPLAWYPVWFAALDDAGIGPRAGGAQPVAHAQVAVQAVRRFAGGAPLASAPSAALTVTAVDAAAPSVPEPALIEFDPQATCVRTATRADWYGHSRFTLTWTAQPGCSVRVHRALGDEILRLDRLAHSDGQPHVFNDPAAWPPGTYADAGRRTRVMAELAAIDAAATAADALALEAAYAGLCIDTQRLLARQPYAAAAFVALTPVPVEADRYEDQLDGRSSAHWFYRLSARSASGMESAPSEPTPPICCPDVVAPSPPMVHMALADDNAVKLRWFASSDRDLDHYDIYAARDSTAVADISTLEPVESWAPETPVGGVALERLVSRDPGVWCFWIVAVDASGNRSPPSTMLKGQSLRAAPSPPVWVSAERTPVAVSDRVELKWTHPSDGRLACQVERRPTDGGYWCSVTPWLPRGMYSCEDVPPDLTASWEYRLRVRDHLGQVASVWPVARLEVP